MESGEVFASVILGIFVIAAFLMAVDLEDKADDADNIDVVHLDDLVSIALLSDAKHFVSDIYRQSGNKYREQVAHFWTDPEDDRLMTASDAINQVLKTFRRAKIASVVIEYNTEKKLTFRRLYHDHRGVKEGRKVYSATILGGHFGQEFVDAINTHHENNPV